MSQHTSPLCLNAKSPAELPVTHDKFDLGCWCHSYEQALEDGACMAAWGMSSFLCAAIMGLHVPC